MAVSDKVRAQVASVFSGVCTKKKVCPVKDIMARYGDKWSMYTVLMLARHERMRFTQLRSSITGISQRMLTVTLRSLEEDGIVVRTIYPEVPPKVEYKLTPLGESLVESLVNLAEWAEKNVAEIMKSRKKHESSTRTG